LIRTTLTGRRTAALAALCAAALTAGCGGGDDSSSEETASSDASLTQCDVNGKQQDLGASYVTSIEVSGVTCPKAELVVKAYHACRQKNGGAEGTCETAVLGFTCTEDRPAEESVPGVQFNATAECTLGVQKITSAYTQNL
jgi:hypothetical protein